MKAWGHPLAHAATPFWTTNGVPVVLLEYDDGHCAWYNVADGTPVNNPSNIADAHKGRLIEAQHWPRWYKDIDERYVDEGI